MSMPRNERSHESISSVIPVTLLRTCRPALPRVFDVQTGLREEAEEIKRSLHRFARLAKPASSLRPE